MKVINKAMFRNECLYKASVLAALFALAFLFVLNSPLNIWLGSESYTDSSVFKYVAFAMSKGYMPYRDAFDHKGPLIYLINLAGMHISYYRGIWVIELLTIFITFLFMYKISRLCCNRFSSLVLLLISITPLFGYYEGGNLVEEYAMPFIAASLYIFMDYFKNGRITNCRLIMCGISFGAVCMLRPNMITTWVVFCMAVLILCTVKKQFAELWHFIFWFILGFCVIVMPIIIWLAVNNSFDGFIQDVIVFNKLYSSPEGGRSLFSAKWYSFFAFFNNGVLLASFVFSVLLLLLKKELVYMAYIAYIFTTLLFMCLSGMTYGHYGMVLVPAIVFPMASFWAMLENSTKQHEKLTAFLTVVYILSTLVLPNWINLLSGVGNLYEKRHDNHISEYVKQICNYIITNTDDEDTISVYGNWDVIYVISHRLSASKYSYQFPIGSVMPSIIDEYFSELEEQVPKIIIVPQDSMDDRISEFLNKHGYAVHPENAVIWTLPK